MPIHKMETPGTYVQLWKDAGDSIRVDFDTLRGVPGPGQARELQGRLQEYLDFSVERSALEDETPDKARDPNRYDLFWERRAGVDYITGRDAEVVVTWIRNKGFNIELTRMDASRRRPPSP